MSVQDFKGPPGRPRPREQPASTLRKFSQCFVRKLRKTFLQTAVLQKF